MPTLTSLAEEILANAKTIDAALESANQNPTTYDADTIMALPGGAAGLARKNLIDKTVDLKALAQGPVAALVDIMFNWTDQLSLHAVYHYDIVHAVPISGTITYADLSCKLNLPETLLRRILRHAMSNHIFAPGSDPDTIRHTATSRLIATIPGFADAVGLQTAELAPCGSRFIDAIEKYGGDSGEPAETAFSLANATDDGVNRPIFDVLAQQPERARRFGSAMKFFTTDEGWDLKHLVAGFDWVGVVDVTGGVVVDVGGGVGSVSLLLAAATKHCRFIVQDLPHVIEQAQSPQFPVSVKGRIEFMPHDFFAEQSVNGLGGDGQHVFLLRWILHDWSDKYCVKILKALVPALKDGTRVVIFEYVLSEEVETRTTERMGGNLDLIMKSCFNGAERTKAEYTRLLRMADRRFIIRDVVKPEGSTMSVLDVEWKAL